MKELLAELVKQLSVVPPGTWDSIAGVFASISGAVVLVLTKRPDTLAEAVRLFTVAVLISTYMAPWIMKKWFGIESPEINNVGRFISALGAVTINKKLNEWLSNKQPPTPGTPGQTP